MSVIEIDGLTKQFGDVVAVDDLSLSVEGGEVFGFLGPNGAGKSTTINAMLDFTKPSSGAVRVFGRDTRRESVAVRQRSGLLLEGYGAYPRLTGREHVQHAIDTKDADDDPDALLDRVGLDEAARERRAGGYSKGMRQRMAIAVALVGDPDLLVLDEPSTGLDPNGARMLREVVTEEADRGATVFFSSHILEQVEAVADRIGILLDGRLAAVGEVEELRDELGAGATLSVWLSAVPDELLAEMRAVEGVREVTARHGRVEVDCDGRGETKLRVLNAAADAGLFEDFAVREASLSDVFSKYTEGDASEGIDGDASGLAAGDASNRDDGGSATPMEGDA
ncbi:ABC transporter ATP-binding protein [Halorussus litoreus]|uniref:ABC transporter ATP-binding protein n=1 Tax=Halorussus litoreus TaxID=1710536 RepID=UPI000E23B908|nr:ABC transporter ATP-binding protein [Halorussus litoreus]